VSDVFLERQALRRDDHFLPGLDDNGPHRSFDLQKHFRKGVRDTPCLVGAFDDRYGA